jgi:hypothetical protein
MPIRIASLHRQIEKSGAKLHRAVLSRIHSHGADDALMEERRILKEAQATRRAQAMQPKPKASRIVREAKAPKEPQAPKAHKEKAPKTAKAAKPHISRAEKAAKKAEALEAAKRAAKKSAKS